MTTSPITLLRHLGTAAVAGSLLAGAVLGGAAPASAATTPLVVASSSTASSNVRAAASNRDLVNAWYRTFLGRSALGDTGSNAWVGDLDRGASPDAVLSGILTSPEHATSSVRAIYRAYLARGLDAGAGYWIDAITAGRLTAEQVEQQVAASPEYLRHTSYADQVVHGWYTVILNRNPTPGETAYWDGQIHADGAPSAVQQLWYTPEAAADRVQAHYTTLLGRSGTPGELAYWFEDESAGDVQVVIAFATSPEYRARAAQ